MVFHSSRFIYIRGEKSDYSWILLLVFTLIVCLESSCNLIGYSFFMSLASILVVLIQTPGSPRANPLINILEGSQRIQLSLLPATMIQNLSDVRVMNIEVRQDRFNLLENRDMRPQEIGCAHSHNLARDVISNSLYGGVILEDDARISDLKNFIDTVTDFLMVERGNPSVLNLTGLNFHKHRFNGSSATQLPLYLKIFGQPSLAVGYALTAKAARVLREANTPIAYVSDWPTSICRFYVPPSALVLHGDEDTFSIIARPDDSFRDGISKRHKLRLISPRLFLIFVNRKYGARRYFKEVFYNRIAWRVDNMTLVLRLRIINRSKK